MRTMVEGDIEFALKLTDCEGWAYTQPEFERMLRMPHAGSYVWEEEEPVGFITSIQYGESAVIGHLVVSDKARGKQVGRKLLEATLRELDDMGVVSVVVFSTRAGERLYRSCGFRYSRDVTSYGFTVSSGGASPSCPRLLPEDIPEVCAVDEEVFGDDRSLLLKELFREYPSLCYKTVKNGRISGYVFGRRNPIGGDVGPWSSASGSPDDALGLLDSVLRNFRGERMDLGFFSDAPVPRALLDGHTSVKNIPVKLMVRGSDRYPSDHTGAIGIAGFELG